MARAAVVVAASICVVLAAEVVLRILEISYPRQAVRDEDRGTARLPGYEGWQTDEGRAYVRINQEGFRDRERVPDKPPNTLRIAMLGDSMVEAQEVPVEQRFTEVLEGLLNQRRCFASRRVEVLNFGISGYGTAQELMVLRHHVWKYQPDVVVLGIMTGNDIRNNSKQLDNDSGRPYFVLEDGGLRFDDSFRRSDSHIKTGWERAGYVLIDWSRIAQLAYQGRATLQKRRSLAEALARTNDVPADVGLDNQVYKEPTNDLWRDAWKVTEALLVLMQREVVERGAQFLAVTLSNTTQVHPDVSYRRSVMDKLGVHTLSYPDDRISAAGQRDGYRVVNLAPRMLQHVEKHGSYLHGFPNTKLGTGHWNQEGHQMVAELLAADFCSAISSPQ